MQQANRILATSTNNYSRVKINEKYFLQIPNELENELIQNEKQNECQKETIDIEYYEYPFTIDLIEKDDGRVIIKSLVQLVKLIKYFRVDQNESVNILRDYLGLKKLIPENFQKNLNLEKALTLIISYSQNQIDNLFISQYPDRSIQETLQNEYQLKYFVDYFHESIFSIQFLPCDFLEIEQYLVQKKNHQITDKQKQDFLVWKGFLRVQGTRNINIFLEKYNLKDSKYTETSQIQEFIDKSTNKYNLEERGQSQSKAFKKISVEMRDVNGKMRLATKDSYQKHISYLFKPSSSSNNLNDSVLQSYKIKINQQQPLLCFYIDIKDLCQNVSYKFIKEDLKLNKVEQYLRNRRVYHFDIKEGKKLPLNVKKGIFIGEVFTPYVVNKVCNTLKEVIYGAFQKALKKLNVQLHNLQIFKFQDDYFIEVFNQEQLLYTSKKFVNYLKMFEDPSLSEQILEEVKNELAKKGFEFNESKIRVLHQRQKQRKLWQLNNEGKLVDCDNFEIFKQDMLSINNEPKKQYQEEIDFINNLLVDPICLETYSELELFAIQKMTRWMLKTKVNLSNTHQIRQLQKTTLYKLNLTSSQANYSSYNQY